MTRRSGPRPLTHRPVVPASVQAVAGLSPLGRLLYPDLHHRRVVAAIAAARAKVAQTAENPRDWHPEGLTTADPKPRSQSGCNPECA